MTTGGSLNDFVVIVGAGADADERWGPLWSPWGGERRIDKKAHDTPDRLGALQDFGV